jgi:hypothetical protein
MSNAPKEVSAAEVFDYTIYKMNKLLLKVKRNPRASQEEVQTLESIIKLYNEDKIVISWNDGEPYMHVNPESGFDEEDMKSMFKKDEVGSY